MLTDLILTTDFEHPSHLLYRGMTSPIVETEGTMIERTNYVVSLLSPDYDIVGWMADDNRWRTTDWDIAVREAFDDPTVGFVAVNDLFWSERDKPSNIFVRRSIVNALGWYANPAMKHFYMEDALRLLGITTDSWRYLPDVVCEHLHPAAGKAEWDDAYRAQETEAMYQSEGRAFINWVQNGFKHDREKVLGALRG